MENMNKQPPQKTGVKRLILAAVLLLIAAVCVWGIFRSFNKTIEATAVCRNGTLVLYIDETDIGIVKEGMEFAIIGFSGAAPGEADTDVLIEDMESAMDSVYVISEISQTPVSDEERNEYLLYTHGILPDSQIYKATADVSLSDGIYAVEIIVKNVSAASF